MKCVIVSSAAITKYGRMDAGFFCGTLGKEKREAIEQRKARVAHELQRIAELEAQEQVAQAQHAAMVRRGEVKPI